MKNQEDNKEAVDLKAAWRYKDLVEDQLLGELTQGSHKFDNSKVMGTAFLNEPSRLLNRDLLLHYSYDRTASSLIDLWEAICDQIQGKLSDESDPTIFRLLLPNFD